MKECKNRKNEINNRIEKMNNQIWTGNKIGDEGAKMISESLKINTTLTRLDLTCDENKIMKYNMIIIQNEMII